MPDPIQPANLLDVLSFRISDPGTFVPRQLNNVGVPRETVARWAARAIAAGLEDGTLGYIPAQRLADLQEEISRVLHARDLAQRELGTTREEADHAIAELAQTHAVADATRQMAIDANARLRTQLLAALGLIDDSRTSLSGYISHLVAQRDAMKAALAKEDLADRQAIEDRDRYHEMADKLAEAIAEMTSVEIGEHSSENDPWQNALASVPGSSRRAPEADDRDPELADALHAATSLPRSELLPEVRRLVNAGGWDPSSPQWAVIRAAIAWRKMRAGITTALAVPQARALSEAVDALADAGESQASEPAPDGCAFADEGCTCKRPKLTR